MKRILKTLIGKRKRMPGAGGARQVGAAMTEFLVVAPVLLMLGLGGYQGAMIWQAKTVLDYATFEAARKGAVNHARTGPMSEELGLRLAPVFGGDGSTGSAMSAVTRGLLEAQDPAYTRIEVLSPTKEAFDDFGVDDPDHPGRRMIPNDHLAVRDPGVGARSGVDLRDANLLEIQVTYGYRLDVPIVGRMLSWTLARLDRANASYYANGRLPLHAKAVVRMQSPAWEGDDAAGSNGGNNNGNNGNGNNGVDDSNGGVDDGNGGVDDGNGGVDDGNGGVDDGNGGVDDSNNGDPQTCQVGGSAGGSSPGGGIPFPPILNRPVAADPAGLPSLGLGNPIHVVTGNKYQRETDLPALPGELGLRFSRHYNSRREGWGASGPIGYGWTHSYSARLTETGDGYRLLQADGRRIDFSASPNDSQRYISVRAGDGWLTRLPDGRVRWYSRRGYWRAFNEQGQLIAIGNARGKILRLHYNAQDQLQRVTDPQGRELTLGYYSSGRLKLLIAPDGAKTTYRYDDHNNLIEVARRGGKRRYHYEDPHDPHNLTGLTNENGIRYASWTYDDQDRAIQSAHSGDVGKVTLDFSTPDQTTVTDSQGKVSVYTTTTEGGVARVLRIDGPGCDTCGRGDVEYAYNDQYQLTQIRKKTGQLTEYAYDTKGRLTQISQRNTKAPNSPPIVQRYEYDGRLQPSAVVKASINPTGEHRTEIHYNAQGQPVQLTERGYRPSLAAASGKTDGGFEAIERSTTLSYNAQSDLIEIDGPRTDVDDILQLSYDDKHRLKTLTTPDGIAQQVLAYDKLGRPIQIRKGTQTPTTLAYTERGQIKEVTQGQNKVSYAYDPAGHLTAITGPDGETLTLDYDDAGRATALTGPNGEQLTLGQDTENRLQQSQIAENGLLTTVSYLYDAQNRLEARTTASGDILERYRYNAEGDLVEVEDAEGHVQRLDYGNPTGMLSAGTLGRIGLIQVPPGDSDSARLSGYTDQRGNEAVYIQDDFGQLVAVMSPDNGLQTYHHDAAGNITQETNAEGDTTVYAYDAANRVIRWEDNDGVTTITYHADSGKPATVQSAATSETFDYNREGQLTAQTREIDGHRFTTRYVYDDTTGRLSEKTLPDGQVLHYHYYTDGGQKGRLRAITREDFFGQTTVIGEIHKATNGSQHWVHGNGVTTDIRYSDAGELLSIDHGQTSQLRYHYDEQGRITGIDQDGLSMQYGYDALGRLTYTLTPDGQTVYGYDAAGNRTETTRDGQATSYVYAETGEGNRLQQAGDDRYEYNAAGSPLQKGDLRYDYNTDQRPVRVYRASSGENTHHTTLLAEYAYNSFGERIKKVAYSGNGRKVTYYFYDPEGRLTAEADETGKITAQYVYLADYRPVAKLQKKTIYALHTDRLGTPIKATDKDANTVWAAEYEPFGKAAITTQQISLNLRLPGQYYDEETGTHYNYQRDYDPETGRYLTADPIGLEGGTNLYAYVANNPLALMDPRGESIFSILGKRAAQKVFKHEVKDALKKGVRTRLAKINNPAIRSQLGKELDDILTALDLMDGLSWWDAVEFIPVVGDAVSVTRCGANIAEIGKRIARLENKVAAALNLRSARKLLGKSDGGPGKWEISPKRPKKGQDYQERITGVQRGVEYNVNGRLFDGFDKARNTLIDAKDFKNWPIDKQFSINSVLKEARGQVRAVSGTGTKIEWQVSTKQKADLVRNWLRNANINISVVHVP